MTCRSLSLNPVVADGGNPSGLSILDAYYRASPDVGCYVHPHANGKDFVVYPPEWTEHPAPMQQAWIDLAMKAISESREFLVTMGHMDSNLYVLVTDRSAADVGRSGIAEAYWLLGNNCWAELRQDVHVDPVGPAGESDYFKFVLAHEIGHCFLMENVNNYVPATEWTYTVDWWDESGAEFLAAQVYPRVNFEHARAGSFDLDQTRWLQPYRAVVLLQHYANTTSNQDVIRLLDWFHDIGKVTSADDADGLFGFFNAIYNDPDFGNFYHDFAVTHYRSQVEDPGGGKMPREADVTPLWSQRLVGESGTVSLRPIPANRLVIGELTIPAGYDARLTPPKGSPKRHQQTLLERNVYHQDWTNEVTAVGSCDGDAPAFVLMTHHLETEMTGLEISYTLEKKCPCGDQEITDCCMKPRTSDLQPDHDHRPYYVGPDPIRSKAACMMRCQDACWCRNKHMWSFDAVTKEECDAYYPDGTVRFAPNMPTKCEGMTHPSRTRPPPPKKDVLDVHCGTLCSKQC